MNYIKQISVIYSSATRSTEARPQRLRPHYRASPQSPSRPAVPGALNLITAIATAYMDSVPMVVITGQVNSDQIGRDVFQEADITGSAEPFVKHSYLLKRPEDTAEVFKRAFYIAGTGRRGPVLIDVPFDVQKAEIDFEYPETVDIRSYRPSSTGQRQPDKARGCCDRRVEEAAYPCRRRAFHRRRRGSYARFR